MGKMLILFSIFFHIVASKLLHKKEIETTTTQEQQQREPFKEVGRMQNKARAAKGRLVEKLGMTRAGHEDACLEPNGYRLNSLTQK